MNRPWNNQYGARWTEAHDAARRRHIAAGLTNAEAAAAINAEFNTSYSRNAVIGRNNRKGTRSQCLVKNGNHKRKPVVRRPKPAPKPEPVKTFRPKKHAEPPTKETAQRSADVIPLNLPLLELENGMCRWPYGNGPFLFCGNPASDECAYCWEHFRLSLKEAA